MTEQQTVTTLHGPGPTPEHALTVHGYLVARGWVVEDFGYPEQSYPANGEDTPDPQEGWSYPPSYGGVEMNQVDDITPTRLRLSFDLGDGLGDPVHLRVISAGNYGGCAEHIEREQRWRFDDGDVLALADLGAVLDDLEAHARALDPRPMLECRFFGPCGRGQGH